MLVGCVTALVVDGLWTGSTPVAVLASIAAVALALDAVDGRVARRSGTVSALGARFDMEVDAFLLLVLSVYVAGFVGPWVLAIGPMRYLFVAVSRAVPWMAPTVPTRYSAKVVAALQGIVLVVAASGLLPLPLTAAVVAMALVLLLWSFGGDVLWLWRNEHRTVTTDATQAADAADTADAADPDGPDPERPEHPAAHAASSRW